MRYQLRRKRERRFEGIYADPGVRFVARYEGAIHADGRAWRAGEEVPRKLLEGLGHRAARSLYAHRKIAEKGSPDDPGEQEAPPASTETSAVTGPPPTAALYAAVHRGAGRWRVEGIDGSPAHAGTLKMNEAKALASRLEGRSDGPRETGSEGE